jgi:hypothetical protein
MVGVRRSWRAAAVAVAALAAGVSACGGGGDAAGDGAAAAADGGAVGGGDGAQVGDQTAAGHGIGRLCAGNADCAADGLVCFGTGVVPMCSRTCAQASDCPAGTFCNAIKGQQICTPPAYCDPCASRDDGTLGPGYCTTECVIGVDPCPGGASCSKHSGSASIKDFTCRPDSRLCRGDGGQCSPCQVDADCQSGHDCLQPIPDGERFCAQRCDAAACPSGSICTKLGGVGYCYADVGGKPEPTCSAGKKGYCDLCSADWQCASGRCVSKESQSFCAQPGTCSKETESQDCPTGTFCVPTQSGPACVPPPAYKCQLWKACVSAPCGAGEQCVDGLCRKAGP